MRKTADHPLHALIIAPHNPRPAKVPVPINLKDRYGDRFVVTHEESYYAEKPEFRQQEEVWLQIIPCHKGHLMPFDDSHFAACTNHRGPTVNQLRVIPSAQMWQDGDDGVNVVFHIDHFEEVVQVMKPRKRRRLSPEARQALIDRTAKYRFQPAVGSQQTGLECVPVPQAVP